MIYLVTIVSLLLRSMSRSKRSDSLSSYKNRSFEGGQIKKIVSEFCIWKVTLRTLNIP